jgi:hypothetical protein
MSIVADPRRTRPHRTVAIGCALLAGTLLAGTLLAGCRPATPGPARPSSSPSASAVAEPKPPAPPAPQPPAPQPAPPPPATDLTPLGGGLNGQNDWIRDLAFVDAMKTAGQFRALQGGGIDFQHDAPVDAQGWPTTDFGVYVNESRPPLGTHKVSFVTRSRPDVRLVVHPGRVENLTWDAASGRGTADVVLTQPGGEHFVLIFTGTGGGARDVKVIRPGYGPANPPTFTNEYLAHLRNLHPSVLRFMDWTETNRNVVGKWSERTLPTDARQTMSLTRAVPGGGQETGEKGVAWEYAIELANAVGADAWINVPTLADDDYVANLAKLFHAKLRADLHLWVEYSNETWNSAFAQTHWNTTLAQSDGSLNDDGRADRYLLGQRRAAKRTVQIGDAFVREFGSAVGPAGRVRPVLSNQYDNPFLITDQVDFVQRAFGAPNTHLYAIANAPYMEMHDADKRTNLTATDVLDALSAWVDRYGKDNKLDQWNSLGAGKGLKVAAYEGGPDTFGPNNVAAKKAASLDPRMRDVCEKYLKIWYAKGGDQFNWFTIGAGTYDSQYGTWSVTNDITNLDTPKMQAFRDIRQTRLTALRAH